MTNALRVDPSRVDHVPPSGVLVRAQHHERWVNADIAHLERRSLLTWLRSRGGRNRLAENVVLVLLGHPQDETGRR